MTIVGRWRPGQEAWSDRLAAAAADGQREPLVLRAGGLAVAATPDTELHDDGDVACLFAGAFTDDSALAGPSPAAALAAGFEQHGTSVLARLRGVFVAVLWDRRRRRGVIVQDQIGNRSWFTHDEGSGLTFATELRPLLAALPQRPSPDETGIVLWLTSRWLPDGRTLWEGTRRLQYGQAIELSESGWRVFRYWRPEYREPAAWDLDEAAAHVREGARRAVTRHLDGEGRTSILLSGGFDSGVLAAMAAPVVRSAGHELPTYSSAFPGEPQDESEGVGALVSELGLRSTRMRPHGQGSIAAAIRFQQAWQVPLPGPGSIIDQPLVNLAAAEGAERIFDGQGGDEVFAHSPLLIADHVMRLRLRKAYRTILSLPGMTERLRPWQVRNLALWTLQVTVPHRLNARASGLRTPPARHPDAALLLPAAQARFLPVDEYRWKSELDGPRWWQNLAYSMTAARDASGMQDFLRRRAELAGLDQRSPLMNDVDLTELLLICPPEYAFDRRVDRALGRYAMKGVVPEPVRMPTRKSNYAAFVHEVLTGADLEAMRRLLLRPGAEVTRFVDAGRLERHLLNAPGPGGEGWERWDYHTWQAATMELWLLGEHGDGRLERVAEEVGPPPAGADRLAA
jgi:hypothetical protein